MSNQTAFPAPQNHPVPLQPAPIDAHASDLSYCTRLREVFLDLKSRNLLLDEPPVWTTEAFGAQLENMTIPVLQQAPRLQAAVAGITSYTPSKWLLEQELRARDYQARGPLTWDHEREQLALLTAAEQPPPPIQPCPSTQPAPGNKSWSPGPVDVFEAAACQQLSGLCFSGGGIRSATFCLGILQALAASAKLSQFDYLSTVSGGGYIHQWFASWIRNEPGRLEGVQQRLKPLPAGSARAPEQINWLRRYSSYLTPRRGLLSADTWTMFTVWFRNTFLNQIVLFSFLILCLLAARSITYLFTLYQHGTYHLWPPHLVWIVFALLTVSCFLLGRALRSQSRPSTPNQPVAGSLTNLRVIVLIVIPCFFLSAAVALESINAITFGSSHAFLYCYCAYIFELLIAITIGGDAFRTFKQLRSPGWGGRVGFHLAAAVAIIACALLSIVIAFNECYLTGPLPPSPADSEQAAAVSAAQPTPLASQFQLSAVESSTESTEKGTQTTDKLQPHIARAMAHNSAVTDLQAKSIEHAVAPATALVSEPVYQTFVPFPTILYGHAFRVADFINRHLYPPSRSLADRPSLNLPRQDAAVQQAQNLIAASSSATQPLWVSAQRVYAVIAPVTFFALLFLAMRLQLGLLGRFYTEERREWLARLGGWSAIVSVLWMALSGISLFGPILFYWLFESSATRVSGISVTVAIQVITLASGASSKSDGKPRPRKLFGYKLIDLVSILGAPLCILTMLIIASGLIQHVISGIPASHPHLVFILVIFIAVIFLIFGWRVDVNEFSLHGFYRNRLARCYLGATNPARRPDPFTGFDEHTEASTQSGMRLSDLLPERFGGQGFNEGTEAQRQPYDGPFPIFCSTLNLTFGEDLAWQERKGASFAFTPLYSGYHVGWTGAQGKDKNTTFNGYIPTAEYAYPGRGIHLATVTAISGAALSPNMGFSSQPAVAFLMTLFNVRLGWWLANPRRPKVWPSDKMRPTPRFGIVSLLRELFGLSNDTSNYVCLCDGGRFENMGLYELVRRRCMLIVICDAEMDSMPVFEGIGLAISKCRTDFGAEITLKLDDLIPILTGDKAGTSASHFEVGTIRYPKPPGTLLLDSAFLGKVLYLKTSITGKEAADILHYRRAYPNFPQDSTLNQWFTESQFECYRRLGQLTGEEVSPFLYPPPPREPTKSTSST